MTVSAAPSEAEEIQQSSSPSADGEIACECMLCDDPEGHEQMPVLWRLVWDFSRPPAVKFRLADMLLCDHCLHDWLNHPDDFGGDAVRFHLA